MSAITPLCAMPNQTASDGLYALMLYTNNNNCVGGILFPLIWFAIYFITAVIVYGSTNSKGNALLFSSFIAFVLGLVLVLLNLLNVKFMYLALLLLALGGGWSKMENG